MAFLLEYTPKRCSRSMCKRPARVELIDYRNESRGHFCKPCGDKALKTRLAFESSPSGAIR